MPAQSLADFLGPVLPAQEEVASPAPQVALDSKSFSRAVLNSQEFRDYIVNSLKTRDLPAAVVCRLMDYGWGKPVEKFEVKDTTPLANLSAEELEARAVHLAEIARSLRTKDESVH